MIDLKHMPCEIRQSRVQSTFHEGKRMIIDLEGRIKFLAPGFNPGIEIIKQETVLAGFSLA